MKSYSIAIAIPSQTPEFSQDFQAPDLASAIDKMNTPRVQARAAAWVADNYKPAQVESASLYIWEHGTSNGGTAHSVFIDITERIKWEDAE